MTFRDIIGVMLRRWYLCVLILAAAGSLAWTYDRDSGGYTTDTVVIFTKPATSTLQPDNGAGDVSVISFAGAIANDINGANTTPLYAAPDAPLYGAGVREGILVGVPNAGGQWSTSLTTAEIDIQIVGRSPAWVAQQQHRILAEIHRSTAAQQSGTRLKARISATTEPLSTEITHIMPAPSSRLTAFAAIGIASILAAGAVAIMFDRLVELARNRRTQGGHTLSSPAVEALS
ncbi:hypothetical protein [Microlunatus soli]|uniref:Uncharacterized protein n=1 Tax=Microlunatus soli TaxID=630515 RepID=A0A1H1SNU9_9ACTN|nr:hypothetical protein [Microlunatus soli]SDS49581.1 hypothetical protein SAMN04489812_2081 [Microlunatus soli]